MKPKGTSDSVKVSKTKNPSSTKKIPKNAPTPTKRIQKRPVKSVPAKGLESDSESEDLLDHEVDEENALAELEQQQGHIQGTNEDDQGLLEGFESDSSTSSTNLNLPPVPTNRSKKLAKKAARAAQNNISTPSTPGTIYLGHIPHGFFEKQMHAYFSQFGTISRLRLSRNRRTGKSKHYGWVEFGSKEVAEIVAETMDGYLIHPHRLVCKVVEVDERVWKGANKVFKRVPWQRLAREELEGKRTREKWTELETRDDERRRERNEKIKEAGIEYEFPLRGEKRKAPQEEQEDNQGEETKKAKPKKGKTGEKATSEKSGKEKRVVSGSKNKAKK